MAEKFKLTYATMFNPPEELHTKFDQALATLKANLGKEYGMIINGKDVVSDEKFEDNSPINTDWVLAVMQKEAEDTIFIPDAETSIKENHLLIIMGKDKDLAKLNK